jgi:hypothetical protein
LGEIGFGFGRPERFALMDAVGCGRESLGEELTRSEGSGVQEELIATTEAERSAAWIFGFQLP